MTSLRQENTLYRNQLKMAEEKMEALNDTTKAIEKISSQLQDMIKANNNGAGANVQNGGQGGPVSYTHLVWAGEYSSDEVRFKGVNLAPKGEGVAEGDG